jgi:hypothetical protein
MKKLLVAGIAVTAFGVMQTVAADVYVRPIPGPSNGYPWLLLLLSPAALACAWITFHVLKSLPNLLSKIGALLRWGSLWVACLGGGCSYVLNGPYTIQIACWGGFAWIVGVYVTLTWANLWEPRRLGATSAQSVRASDDLSQPQPNSAPNSLCRELLVVERWLRVIDELSQNSNASCGSNIEDEQISCSGGEVGKEGQNFRSSQGNVILLVRGQSPNRRRTQSSLQLRGHHRQDRHQHPRARCRGPALS